MDIAHLATEPGMALTGSPKAAQEPKEERAAERQFLDYPTSNADHDVHMTMQVPILRKVVQREPRC